MSLFENDGTQGDAWSAVKLAVHRLTYPLAYKIADFITGGEITYAQSIINAEREKARKMTELSHRLLAQIQRADERGYYNKYEALLESLTKDHPAVAQSLGITKGE